MMRTLQLLSAMSAVTQSSGTQRSEAKFGEITEVLRPVLISGEVVQTPPETWEDFKEFLTQLGQQK